MSHKTSPARRAAFLQAVRETGNQTLAAERAKVSRSWVQLHRSTDPQFRAEVAAAVAVAKAHLDSLGTSGEGTRKPGSGWGFLDGEELVVKGSNGRRTQIARARLKQWTPRVEQRFLAALMATCNVRAACAEVGMSVAGAYAHRRRWRRFAELWDAAVAEGYARIEIALLENALNLFSLTELPPETALRGMDTAQAIHLIHMHKHGVLGIGRAPGERWRPPRGIEAVSESIRRKVEIIRAGSDIPPEARAADARAYAARRRSAAG